MYCWVFFGRGRGGEEHSSSAVPTRFFVNWGCVCRITAVFFNDWKFVLFLSVTIVQIICNDMGAAGTTEQDKPLISQLLCYLPSKAQKAWICNRKRLTRPDVHTVCDLGRLLWMSSDRVLWLRCLLVMGVCLLNVVWENLRYSDTAPWCEIKCASGDRHWEIHFRRAKLIQAKTLM